MHDPLKEAFWELKTSLNKVMLIEAFLEACIIFLSSYLIISLGGFLSKGVVMVALAIAGAYFFARSIKNTLQDKVALVGTRYGDLYEELLTARDHPARSNEVVADLHTEAVRHMAQIEESAFFDTRSVAFKVMGIIALCALVLVSAPINLQETPLVKNAIIAAQGAKLIHFQFEPPKEEELLGVEKAGDKEGIATEGRRRTVDEGIVKAKFEVPTSNFEVNIKEEEEGDNANFDSVFPTEIGDPDATLYGESIPKEQQALVKNYFKISAEV